MSEQNVPEWAGVKARKLISEENGSWTHYDRSWTAFARYIAEHEEEPADPLLVEAREIADAYRLNLSAMPTVGKALQAALRRGIELSKEPQP